MRYAPKSTLLRLSRPEAAACAACAAGFLLFAVVGRCDYAGVSWLVSAAIVCLGLWRREGEGDA